MDKSRQKFEEFISKGDYPWVKGIIPVMWMVWEASRESLEVELPYKHQPKFYSYEDGINTGLNMCRDILISNGVKVKNE
ncbi:hypothetical protein KZA80_07615 [Proteus terrae]|uniref:hypothetical protein n=1 Tax=Proteus terrae TaxID=1574161 RepID=UPI0021B2457D|nr:hypothetical protein [Proteus terrae]UXA35473.1 hypothetical protein KZA80_06025 [Proteus terrae]UXA35765.1 hypothetical protein KZA80_07615 [Proteus terrae]